MHSKICIAPSTIYWKSKDYVVAIILTNSQPIQADLNNLIISHLDILLRRYDFLLQPFNLIPSTPIVNLDKTRNRL